MTSIAIEPLVGLEGIRKRPGMYVGEVSDGTGMHVLLDLMVGRALDDGGTTVRVTFDGPTVCVEDDGPGKTLEAFARQMTEHTREAGRFGHLLAVPLAAVCALASDASAELRRDGRAHVQRYARGQALGPFQDVGATTRVGTRVMFTPDFTLLAELPWDLAHVAQRCRELVAFEPGVTIAVADDAWCFPDGAADLVRFLASAPDLIDPLHVCTTVGDVALEVAIAWSGEATTIGSFVNHERATDGAAHVAALLAGIRAGFGARIKRPRSFRARIERGLIAIVHVRHAKTFARAKLKPEFAEVVRAAVAEAFAAHLEAVPALLDFLLLQLEA